MKVDFYEIDINNEADWVHDVKEYKDRSSIDSIACDLVFHQLNNEYFKDADGTGTTFEQDTEYSFWCDDHLYVQDGVMRVIINGKFYSFDSIYVTKTNHIIVRVLEYKDIWEDDNVLEQENEDNEYTVHYFKVEY